MEIQFNKISIVVIDSDGEKGIMEFAKDPNFELFEVSYFGYTAQGYSIVDAFHNFRLKWYVEVEIPSIDEFCEIMDHSIGL